MRKISIFDFDSNNKFTNAAFPLIPIFRKYTGADGSVYNKLWIKWLWFTIMFDDYSKINQGWRLNRAWKSWFSIDSPYFRFCIN